MEKQKKTKNKNGHEDGDIKAMTALLSRLAPLRPLFSFQSLNIHQASNTGFTELLVQECTIDW